MHVFEKNSNIFELLTEAISEGILIVNEKQEIVASNTMTDKMFGYSKDELKGKPLHILIPETYRKVHKKHISKYQKNQSKRRMAFGRNLFGATKNGAEFPIEVGLNPFSLYGQNFVLALIMDVTERKRSELEIGHLAKILDESLNEIYIFDAESLYFSSANYGAQKNTGYELAEFKQLTPLDLKPEFTETKFRALMSPILENKRKKVVFETTHRRKNGTTYPVEVHMQSSTKGKKNTIVAITLDISDRKNYTQKLEKTVESRTKQLKIALAKERELNDLKTKFLSLVSHEFKTPLSGILISATLVGKYPREDQQDKRDKHLKTIIGEVNQLNAILTDFLSIERLEAGKEVYKIVDFSLSKVINEVVYSANMLLKNGQHIRYPQNIDDVILHQDEKIISLCLTNL